jgi:hypothetical protein
VFDVESRRDSAMKYGFFDVEHSTFLRAARQEMLRALKHKIPAEM